METRTTDTVTDEFGNRYELPRDFEALMESATIATCRTLARELLASIDKALSKAKSSQSYAKSPCKENSEQPFKKRRTQGKYGVHQVKVVTTELDDGYSWRKYGQKKILGCKYPRDYYRCTHRDTQGCLAMKKVQGCDDDDPATFNVIYMGCHTCQKKSDSPNFEHRKDHEHEALFSLCTRVNAKTEMSNNKDQGPGTPEH